jgi:predicted ArsR family transcriptional regulator
MSAEAQPWADLVVLAERERDLVREGRWEEVPVVAEQRLKAAEALGAPPPAARRHLERLVVLQGEIHAGLSAGRAFTMQKLGGMNHKMTAMRGYAGPAPARHGLVNHSA